MRPQRLCRHTSVIVLTTAVLWSCTTREPESPTGSRGTFTPPTSPSIVMENLLAALSEKNTENYMRCLADPQTRSSYDYEFTPSAEARARFLTLFNSWSLQRERQAFISMTSRLAPEQSALLFFETVDVNFSSPDSTVYVMDYELNVEHGISSIPTTLLGTMSVTITPETSGQWSISRWSDAKRPSDTVESTWSLLKAQLSN
jgi:hypothetical protein